MATRKFSRNLKKIPTSPTLLEPLDSERSFSLQHPVAKSRPSDNLTHAIVKWQADHKRWENNRVTVRKESLVRRMLDCLASRTRALSKEAVAHSPTCELF